MRQLFIKLALRTIALFTLLLSFGAVRVNADIHYVDMTKVGNTRLQNDDFKNLDGQGFPGIGFPTGVRQVASGNLIFDIPLSGFSAYRTGQIGGAYHQFLGFEPKPSVSRPSKVHLLLVYTDIGQLSLPPNPRHS
jgi:hypothetical protein